MSWLSAYLPFSVHPATPRVGFPAALFAALAVLLSAVAVSGCGATMEPRPPPVVAMSLHGFPGKRVSLALIHISPLSPLVSAKPFLFKTPRYVTYVVSFSMPAWTGRA